MHTVTDKTIASHHAFNPSAAAADAIAGSIAARIAYPNKFEDVEHMTIAQDAETVVRQFFTVSKGIYINARANKGKPFTAIKVDGPQWTTQMDKLKGELLYSKLAALGDSIETVQTPSSFIVRVH